MKASAEQVLRRKLKKLNKNSRAQSKIHVNHSINNLQLKTLTIMIYCANCQKAKNLQIWSLNFTVITTIIIVVMQVWNVMSWIEATRNTHYTVLYISCCSVLWRKQTRHVEQCTFAPAHGKCKNMNFHLPPQSCHRIVHMENKQILRLKVRLTLVLTSFSV